MKKSNINAAYILTKVRKDSPVVYHLTNLVTIYDCANVVKTLGASPVMAHATEEVCDMVSIASSLVLNIGTLTQDFIKVMKKASIAANKKGIPVVLDVCGAGASRLRDRKCFELLDQTRISIIKGNASEIARIAGEKVSTKGVDSCEVAKDILELSQTLSRKRNCVVVATGKHDVVSDGKNSIIVGNGHELMSHVVGTGCMASSVIGAFSAIAPDLLSAASAALVCFGIAGELAAKRCFGTGSFKERLFDSLYNLDKETINKLQKLWKK
jgi:hydroxyethylthiazole kinase